MHCCTGTQAIALLACLHNVIASLGSVDPWEWCVQASGAALALLDAVVEASSSRTAGSEVPAGYSIARPPGHHATANQPMGFCLLNNVAIAARYAQQHHGLHKVHTALLLLCTCYHLFAYSKISSVHTLQLMNSI